MLPKTFPLEMRGFRPVDPDRLWHFFNQKVDAIAIELIAIIKVGSKVSAAPIEIPGRVKVLAIEVGFLMFIDGKINYYKDAL
jgi:hypothetical protein